MALTGDGLQITLLGTGSPSPNAARHQPAALVEWGDGGRALVDAGDGVVYQILAAGRSVAGIGTVLLTHLHWDHVLGYPGLVWGGWTQGRSALRVVGPAGTGAMHGAVVEGFYRDQAEWAIALGYRREGWDGIVVEDVAPGWSADLDGCRVEAGTVVHPPVPALGYRFSHGGRSLVVSGDTARCDELVALARGADLLVVDACAAPPPPSAPAARAAIIGRLHAFHASPQDCVDMAAEAGVGTVVLTHHLPEVEPEFDASRFRGRVIVGRDLQTVVA